MPPAGLSVVLAPPAGQPVVWAPQAGQPFVPSPQGVARVTNTQKTNEVSPDSVFKAPRTNNNEVNAAQSLVLNDNQLPSKKVYISKTPHRNKKGIRRMKKKPYFN